LFGGRVRRISGAHIRATRADDPALVLRAGTLPMARGTSLLFDDKSGILYLKGAVPYFQVYPGAYIPRALEFHREDGETSGAEVARELLGLSQLNFNNTQFDTGDPATIRAARRVGDILKHVPQGRRVNSRFCYFTSGWL
jgi:hypothetical protein